MSVLTRCVETEFLPWKIYAYIQACFCQGKKQNSALLYGSPGCHSAFNINLCLVKKTSIPNC